MLESFECGDDDAALKRAENVLGPCLRKRGCMLRLMEKNGATFVAHIRETGEQYCASYCVKSGYNTIADETPRSHWFASRIDAQTWLRQSAAAREFTTIRWIR